MKPENMSRKDFEKVKSRNRFDSQEIFFDYLVLLPTRRKHESGWRMIEVIGCTFEKAVCKVAEYSDVIHIEGIGGYGEWNGRIPSKVKPRSWQMDCFLKSGLFRLWVSGCQIKAGLGLSSFEIYSIERIK